MLPDLKASALRSTSGRPFQSYFFRYPGIKRAMTGEASRGPAGMQKERISDAKTTVDPSVHCGVTMTVSVE